MSETNTDGRPADRPDHDRLRAIEALTFEIIPLNSADAAIEALPPASRVSVTCSPVKGIAATQDLTDKVRAAGHDVVPHLAARMVESRNQVDAVAKWLRTEGIRSAFIIGGDAEQPNGPYPDGATLLRDLLAADPQLTSIGVPSYPDGHPAIPDPLIDQALRDKQAILGEAEVSGWTSTQMCFDSDRLIAWANRERQGGLTLPIHLGVAGVVDRSKLMSMGMRLGVGASLRYLRKNRKAVGKLMSRSDYDPDTLLEPLAPHLGPLGITGVHCFTFNQVEATAHWRSGALAEGRPTGS